MALRAGGLIAAALLAAGCGGGGGGAQRPAKSTAPAPSVAPALTERARECGLEVRTTETVPEDLALLVPEPYLMIGHAPAGAGYRLTLFWDLPLDRVLPEVARRGAARGTQELFREREPFDAELSLREADGEVYAFRFSIPGRCNDAVAASVVRLQT